MELVSKLLPESRIAQLVSQTASFSGPLPHPEIFNRYAEVIPDAPERILKVFEDDSKHARDIAILALEAQRDDNRRAHWMAWSLVIAGFMLSVVFALFMQFPGGDADKAGNRYEALWTVRCLLQIEPFLGFGH